MKTRRNDYWTVQRKIYTGDDGFRIEPLDGVDEIAEFTQEQYEYILEHIMTTRKSKQKANEAASELPDDFADQVLLGTNGDKSKDTTKSVGGVVHLTMDEFMALEGHDPDNIPLSFESPESSSIHSARYDPDTRQMFITFQYGKTPTEYRYGDVDLSLWIEFVQSKSRGSFVASRIRPMYNGTKV